MRIGISLVLILLLFSRCAQVGTLSGGAPDNTAPQPDSASMQPANGQTLFNGQQWIIPFDEYIALNNPSETFFVLPADIQPELQAKGRKLRIRWKETLRANTTYSFYLNGTVTDITEKNDSLYVFVFSTGESIDSLSINIQAVDAATNKALPKTLVAFYPNFSDSISPTYVGMTSSDGWAKINYMKSGLYDVVAFEDKNRNWRPDLDESFGFIGEKIRVDAGAPDSILLRVSPPAPNKLLKNTSLLPPDLVYFTSPFDLSKAKVSVNGTDQSDLLFRWSPDSIGLYLSPLDTLALKIKVETEGRTDSTTLRLTKQERQSAVKWLPNFKDKWKTGDSLYLLPSKLPESDHLPSIMWRTLEDSSEWSHLAVDFVDRQLKVPFPGGEGPIELLIVDKDSTKLKFELLPLKKLGLLTVKLADFPEEKLWLELIQNGQSIARQEVLGNIVLFDRLLPGNYAIRILEDKNKNGRWDAGDYNQNIQPERYYYLDTEPKVRANWENEIEWNYEQR